MKSRYKLTITGTSFAAVFTTLSFLMETYAGLWLTLEAIILPAVYIIGYEMLLKSQKKVFEQNTFQVNRMIKYTKK